MASLPEAGSPRRAASHRRIPMNLTCPGVGVCEPRQATAARWRGGWKVTSRLVEGRGINWASNGIYARIGKMDRAGQWIWMAGNKATGFAKPGQFYKPGHFAGIVDDCLFVTDWNGQYRLYDKNSGLYAGTLFNDAFRGAAPDEDLISVEFNEGHVYRHAVSGETYALAGAAECLKLFRVTGLREIERFQGTVSLGRAAP